MTGWGSCMCLCSLSLKPLLTKPLQACHQPPLSPPPGTTVSLVTPSCSTPHVGLRSLGALAEQAHRSPLVTRKSSFTSDLKSLSCLWRDIKLKFQSTWQKTSSHEHDIFLESQHVFSLLSLPRPLHSLLGTIHKNMRQNKAARATRFRSRGSLFL